jgi:hypothetical protein
MFRPNEDANDCVPYLCLVLLSEVSFIVVFVTTRTSRVISERYKYISEHRAASCILYMTIVGP